MAWQGYYEYDGNEIINVQRTETYMRNAGMRWFRPQFKNDALAYMLGQGLEYSSPFLDDAPWADPDWAPSYDFYGVYPLDITGIEDSSRTSAVVESLGNGGSPGRLRHGTKTIVFNTLILARTEDGAEYGLRWLKDALLGGACEGDVSGNCIGFQLCYLSAPPDMHLPSSIRDRPGFASSSESEQGWGSIVADPEECLEPYWRSLRKVVFNTGPAVTSKRETTDGGQVWTVTFTAVAGSNYELSAERPLLEGLLSRSNPWVGGQPPGAVVDTEGFVIAETSCAEPEYQPVFDPLCPASVPPPQPPSVPLGCYTPPRNWRRRQVTIPKASVPVWGEVVPRVEIHARGKDIRNLRLRYYADPFGTGDTSEDPCAHCGDIVVSYVPQDHTLVLDGSEEQVYVISPGGARRRADSLVFASDGSPFEWPVLTCGFGYILALDLPQTQTPPVVDLSLFSRTA